VSRAGALMLLAGMAAIGVGADPFAVGRKAKANRVCPKCGGKAMWSTTTAYCTRSRCGWFEVVPPGPKRFWREAASPYPQNCNECGRIIVPHEQHYADSVSGHLVRHVGCHKRAAGA
jgi:hypothetical protein